MHPGSPLTDEEIEAQGAEGESMCGHLQRLALPTPPFSVLSQSMLAKAAQAMVSPRQPSPALNLYHFDQPNLKF